MTPFLSFLLKANLTLVLLYGVYFLFFRRDTFYGHIRRYLLITILSAVIFPLINLSAWLSGSPAVVGVSQYVPDIEQVYQYVVTHLQTEYVQPQTEYFVEPVVAKTIPWNLILRWCWITVAIFMLGKRLFQYACIVRLWRRYPQQRHGNSTIIAIDEKNQPFSFFGRIFLNPSLYSGNELDEIVTHEQIHCQKRHSVDIILSEAFVCLFWFNPVAWLLRHDLKQNLEYQTDRMTLQSGFDRKRYQYNLLRVSGGTFQIVNHFLFNIHHLKKRIIMINRKKSPKIMAAKYLLVVPALAAALLVLQMTGLQAADECLNISVSNNESTELANSLFHENVYTEKILVAETDTTSTMKEDKSVIVYKGKFTQRTDVDVSTIYDFDSIVFHGNPFSKELVFIDGKESSVMNIPSHSIERIEILKNEAATRLYGNRGENGVVLITTKKSEPFMNNHAQNPDKSVSGTVTNADGKPLPGVSVIVKGTTTGSVTDMNGKYSLNVPDQSILQFSFVGMDSQEIVVGNQQEINVVMKKDEVIVIGSGTMIRETQIKTETDHFSIRGLEGNNKPLILVDGMEFNDSLSSISPDQIQSIDVLKKELATAIYGEKGANGVIIVFTKARAATADKLVAGTITNLDGKPLPGVSVIVKGTTTGSVTDMNGKYSLNVPDQSILQFSFVGMDSQEIVVGNQKVINVVMKKDESVVIAYGTMNRETQIKTEPDHLRIRNFIGNDNPLIIVDGKEFEENLSSLSTNQIESFSVLKDATAKAVFGEKGKNGVILITLKDEIIYADVEDMPLFNGKIAEDGFREYIAKNVTYPAVAQENGIQGAVWVQFIIHEDGTLSQSKIIRGVDPLLDAEALRVIRSSPKWTPGKQSGKTVKVSYTIPLNFRISYGNIQAVPSSNKVELPNSHVLEEVVIVGYGKQK